MNEEIIRQGNQWIFPDGTILPVVSGGDGEEGAAGNNAEGTAGTDTGQGSGNSDYSLGGDFLKNIPDEHRPILEPYVKQWDAGVTRRFQEYAQKLSPYEELGDPEQLAQAIQFMQLAEQDPQRVIQALQQYLGEDGNAPEGSEDESDFQGLPKEYVDKLSQMEQIVIALADQFMNQQTTSQQAQEDQELEEYLDLLRQEYGDYDEEYVLLKISQGMDGTQAVKAYQEFVNKVGGGQPKIPQPPILGGGGNIPGDSQKVTDLPRDQVKSLVASMISQANQE